MLIEMKARVCDTAANRRKFLILQDHFSCDIYTLMISLMGENSKIYSKMMKSNTKGITL